MKKVILLTMGLILFSSAAQAVLINPDMSTDITDPAVLFNFQVSNDDALPFGFTSNSVSMPPINLTNYVTKVNGAINGIGWLDGPVGMNPGGLGVCSTQDCSNSAVDDAFNVGESITLNVSEAIFVGDLYFRDGDHGLDFTGDVSISIDGGMMMNFALASVITDLASEVINQSITFSFLDTCQNKCSNGFYLAGFGAEVPLPAALPMMIMGLLGLFGFRRFSA